VDWSEQVVGKPEAGWLFQQSASIFDSGARPQKITTELKNTKKGWEKKKMFGMQKAKSIIVLTVAIIWVAANLQAQVPTAQPPKAAGNLVSDSPKFVEDWSSPSLKGSSLVAFPPLVGQVDEFKDYSFEITRVQWRPGDPIDLFIMKPAGVKRPPVILYLYSYPFDNDRYGKDDFRRFLTKNGFAAVGFVSALTGNRYRSGRPMKEWFVSQLRESLATSAHDVQMLLNYLAERGDFDMDHVGMFGEGSGASIAILAAASDSRIKTLDLLNPWCDWPDWMAKSTLIPENERPGFLKPEFLSLIAPLDPVKWLPELKTQKVRLQEVKSVTVTPSESRQKIEAAAPANVAIVRYDDTKAFKGMVATGTVFDWMKRQMQGGTTQNYRASGQAQAKDSSEPERQSQR